MSLTALRASGYRSLRDVELSLGQLNVITGPNGSGKSNLYRVLWLLAQISEGSFARTLAQEGGLSSALWAGPKASQKPVRMTLGFATDEFSFELSCGFPANPSPGSAFAYDPEIKQEAIWIGNKRKPSSTLVERRGGMTQVRDHDGRRVEFPLVLSENESILSQLREPDRFPELFRIRDEIRRWRFYHGFRTDAAAPMRSPQASVCTPVLSHDGSDLAAALQTIREMGADDLVQRAISVALPGRSLEIVGGASALCVALRTQGCTRALIARELSDGTLKYLCLVAALLSERPPALIALNEPGSSLHPDLIRPLAGLIVDASKKSQVWVTTHSRELSAAIQQASGVAPVELQLLDGQTILERLDDEE
jgi:predicted ATPase